MLLASGGLLGGGDDVDLQTETELAIKTDSQPPGSCRAVFVWLKSRCKAAPLLLPSTCGLGDFPRFTGQPTLSPNPTLGRGSFCRALSIGVGGPCSVDLDGHCHCRACGIRHIRLAKRYYRT
jgi:hypothetical protein